MIKSIAVVILMCFSFCLLGQSKWVVDKETRSPIHDVFVFIDNTSIGVATDQNGRYTLSTDENGNQTIVFSHVGYEVERIAVNDNYFQTDSIFLTPFTRTINEVSIVEKAKFKDRKKWIQRFKEAFLGYDAPFNLIEIKNMDEILFRESDSKLQAIINTPLIIENRHLGYNVKFYLEQFTLYNNDDLYLKGSAFFEDLKGKKKQRAKFKRQRKKLFAKTSRSFFSLLAIKDLNMEEYLLGFSSIDKSRNFYDFVPADLDSLMITNEGGEKYSLSLERIFTVVNKGLPLYPGGGNNLAPNFSTGVKPVDDTKLKFATSYYKSNTGQIIFDRSGRILNPLELEEYGYWSQQRIGQMLPTDYKK